MEQGNSLKSSFGFFLRSLCDLMTVNVLWLICSLPVITLGPSTCAAFSVLMKVARDEPSSVLKDFFKAFGKCFKRGIVLELITAALILIAAADIWFAKQQNGAAAVLYYAVSGVLGILILIFITYAFALEARFDNTLKQHLLNAFKLSAAFPGKTILMWLILLAVPLSLLFLPRIAVYYLGWFYVLFGGSVPLYFNSKILRDIFDQIPGDRKNES